MGLFDFLKQKPALPALQFHNTLSGKTEVFKPLSGDVVKMYNCGPTVYDYAHIGNFRAFLFADVLRRYLEFRGAQVRQVMNMTDVGHMTDDSVADATGEARPACRYSATTAALTGLSPTGIRVNSGAGL